MDQRAAEPDSTPPSDEPGADAMIPERALAVYGTLAPGGPNHHVMLGMEGRWESGFVVGYQFDLTWGPADGYPGVCLDPAGNLVPVDIFVSDDLRTNWRRIDQFEGPGYRRVPVEVVRTTDRSDRTEVIGTAHIFEALTHNDE